MSQQESGPVLHVAEPPPAYVARAPLVVDCSVLTAILFSEPSRDDALRIVSGQHLHAPELLDCEIVSAALKKRRGGLPDDVVKHAIELYASESVDLHRVDLAQQLELATRYRLSAYDAAYLCVATTLRAPLATFDEKLAAAARIHLAELH